MRCLFIAFLFISLSLTNSSLDAQTINDNQLWTGGTFGLKLNKKFSVSLREEFRLDNNMSSLKTDFTELGVKFKLNKHFSFAHRFRYIDVPNKKNKRRLSFDAYYSWKKKDFPLSFKYRFRFQDTKKFNSKKQANDYIRNKFTLKYNASKLVDPYFAYEIYFRFDGKNEFRKTRITLGLDWRLSKKMGLTTFYRLQNDINVKTPTRLNIVGLTFAYNLSLRKKSN